MLWRLVATCCLVCMLNVSWEDQPSVATILHTVPPLPQVVVLKLLPALRDLLP